MNDWLHFFPPDTPVLALPGWGAPRLVIPVRTLQERWANSALYPAFRWRARAFRWMLRAAAVAGADYGRKITPPGDWSLGAFIADALPEASTASVLVGTPGPAQKTVVQLSDEQGNVLGYLKYGESLAARARLRREYEILSQLSGSFHPAPLKFGRWHDGEALLLTPIDGKRVPATLPPAANLGTLCNQMKGHTTLPFDEHPWVQDLGQRASLNGFLDPLRRRAWPVVLQHGDLAVWNLRQGPDGSLRAFDWEYATQNGFPHLDAAYYVLQLAALIYRWDPSRASRYAAKFLIHTGFSSYPLVSNPAHVIPAKAGIQENRGRIAPVASTAGVANHGAESLTADEARAIVRLAALDAYSKFQEDGHAADLPSQRWWQSVWTREEA